jgi:V/A-type H+-transporting ATPase subunit E
MSLDKVIDRIEKEGEKEIKSIELESNQQAEQIIQIAKKKSQELAKARHNEAKKLIENLRIQERSIAELEAKKIRLNTEKEMLDATYQECLDALNSISHEKAISSLLNKVKKEMPEAASIYSNKRDEAIVRSISDLKYAGNVESIGGIIAENIDGTMRLDYRYETIASNVWNRSLKEIADKLFR